MTSYTDYVVSRMMWGGKPRVARTRNYQTGSGNGNWRDAAGKIHKINDMEPAYKARALAHAKKMGWKWKVEELSQSIERDKSK